MTKLAKLVVAMQTLTLDNLTSEGVDVSKLSMADVLEQTAFTARMELGVKFPAVSEVVVAHIKTLQRAEAARWLAAFAGA